MTHAIPQRDFRQRRAAQPQPITFTIPGVPIGKARPRVLRNGHAYTPAKSMAYERQVQLAATLAMRGHERLSGAVQATLRFYLPIPASWSIPRRAAAITGEVAPIGKPDLDNLLKSVLDGIRTIVIGDDAVVVEVRATKRYGVEPLTVCTIGQTTSLHRKDVDLTVELSMQTP